MKQATLKITSILMAFITLCCALPVMGVRVDTEAAAAPSQVEIALNKAAEIATKTPDLYNGLCLGFCAACYTAAGFKQDNYATAYDAGSAWIVSTSSKNIPVGALVFFDKTWHPTAGHVGIYAGDGMMYDAESNHGGVMLRPFTTSGYRGWGWYDGKRPTRGLKHILMDIEEISANAIKDVFDMLKKIITFFSTFDISVFKK